MASPDVVVIGAGIVGSSCAYRLALGGARVTLVERASQPATGSTGRSAAGIRHQFSHPVNVRMSRYSAGVLRNFERDFGVDSGYRRVGYLFLIPQSDLAAWREQQAMQRREGARVALLSPAEIAERFPYLDTAGVAGGSFGADDGVLDPHSVTLGFLKAARALGARVELGCEVLALRRRRGGWIVDTRTGTFRADALVNAAGPQAAAIGRLAGVELPIAPLRRNIYLTAPLAGVTHPTPLIIDLASGVYLRSEGERILFGLSNPDEPPGETLAVDWGWLEVTLERALPRFPFLNHATLDRRACWAGLYAVTPDGLPILGQMPGAPGFVNACGFSGHGVQHAPATGVIVAEEVLEGRSSAFEIDDFRFERFAERRSTLEANIV